MTDELTVVLSDRPHTKGVKSQETLAGTGVTFRRVEPINRAFAEMARHQSYDVSEMAIGAYLQAYDAGLPLRLLPIVISGGFHHKSLFASPRTGVTKPSQLRGRRIGVRSYSQTTGLWVRGWLSEEEGIAPADVVWVTREGSHVPGFVDPPNVEHTDEPLKEALREGRIDAAIMGSEANELESLVADHRRRALQWYERHGCVPINHMVVATEEAIERYPEALRALYHELAAAIDARAAQADPSGPPPGPRHGITAIHPGLAQAAVYALEQGLITKPINDLEALFAFSGEGAAHA